jgi:hypothetical protein
MKKSMTIPSFDHNNVLPPHLGTPTDKSDLSPYPCSILELCQEFASSRERIDILKGFLDFRDSMRQNGIINGFQWLNGSFLENIENSDQRPPNDIDVVTFFGGLSNADLYSIQQNFPDFSGPPLAKHNFYVDNYPVDYTYSPDATVELTRYWVQLFTHNRIGSWKGILRVEINTQNEDAQAISYLNS